MKKNSDQLDQMRENGLAMFHDMKTPLASIHGYTELMKDNATELTPQELYEFTSIINRQSVYMKNLLDDLNLTMRLRNQRLHLQFEDVDIVGFIREMTNRAEMIHNLVINRLNVRQMWIKQHIKWIKNY